MVAKWLLWRVPASGVVDDDVGDPGLNEPSRRQTVLPEGVPAVAISEFGLFFGEIKHLAALAENQLIRLQLGLLRRRQLRTGGHGVTQGVHLVEQFAPSLLPGVSDAPGDDSFDLEPGRVGITAGGKGLGGAGQEPFLGKTAPAAGSAPQ